MRVGEQGWVFIVHEVTLTLFIWQYSQSTAARVAIVHEVTLTLLIWQYSQSTAARVAR